MTFILDPTIQFANFELGLLPKLVNEEIDKRIYYNLEKFNIQN